MSDRVSECVNLKGNVDESDDKVVLTELEVGVRGCIMSQLPHQGLPGRC